MIFEIVPFRKRHKIYLCIYFTQLHTHACTYARARVLTHARAHAVLFICSMLPVALEVPATTLISIGKRRSGLILERWQCGEIPTRTKTRYNLELSNGAVSVDGRSNKVAVK